MSAKVRVRANGYCPQCQAPDVWPNPIQAHHLRYVWEMDGGKYVKNILAADVDEDLMPLCRVCHEENHRLINQEIAPLFLPASNNDIREFSELIKRVAKPRKDGSHLRDIIQMIEAAHPDPTSEPEWTSPENIAGGN
jgi:hypothetical protein